MRPPRWLWGTVGVLWSLLPCLSSAQTVTVDGDYLFVNAKRILPTPLHQALWEMADGCVEGEPDRPLLELYVVDLMVYVPQRVMLYGLARWSESRSQVVLFAPYHLHPTVVGHEFLHIQTSRRDDGSEIWDDCVIHFPEALERRLVDPDALDLLIHLSKDTIS